MKIFFSVGEPSGDQHAAHLIHELRRRHPEIECCGFGGPLMSGAGCRIDFRLTDLAVMGLLRIVPMIMKFVRVLRIAVHVFERDRPDAVVLVDFPGFNWWVARKAKKAGIPVIYYLPPQLWAWAPWRIRRMKRLIDHVLCALPFEPKWYSKRGLDVEFVSHPFFDEVADYKLDQETLAALRQTEGRLVAVLPGSRDHEVDRNWPSMQQVLQRVHEQHPDVVFVVACYRDEFRERCQQMLDEAGLKLPIRMLVDRTPEIIEASECCLMVSGSVSLELLARRTPAVILYRVDRTARMLARVLMTCDYISLPNLMAEREVMPEFISSGNPQRDIEALADTLNTWLSNPAALQQRVAELSALIDSVGETGATERAAEAILGQLGMETQRAAA